MAFSTILLFGVDPDRSDHVPSTYLGRVDIDSLPQQTLMELLVEHIEDKGKITLADDSDIQSWRGMQYNEDGDLIKVTWFCFDLHGQIDFQWLPSTITYFRISVNSLKGSADLSHLPASLEEFLLRDNLFDGTLDLTALPESLMCLNASSNQFSGSVCLTSLPPSLISLLLSDNNFSGRLDLKSLPDTLERLHLNSNKFEGYVDFGALPASLSHFDLSDNALLEGRLEKKAFFWTENTKITRVLTE